MVNLARGRMRNKIPELEKALTGLVGPHHRFLLAKQLAHIDFLDEMVDDIGAEIARWFETQSQQQSRAEGGIGGSDASNTPETPCSDAETPLTWEEAVALLGTIPGVNRKTAEDMLAEISILTSAWHMLTYRQPYQELGGDYFDQRRKEAKVNYLTLMLFSTSQIVDLSPMHDGLGLSH
jgi:hypothetical protein